MVLEDDRPRGGGRTRRDGGIWPEEGGEKSGEEEAHLGKCAPASRQLAEEEASQRRCAPGEGCRSEEARAPVGAR